MDRCVPTSHDRVSLISSCTAGQLSEENGGFAPTPSVAEVREQVPRWRLNVSVLFRTVLQRLRRRFISAIQINVIPVRRLQPGSHPSLRLFTQQVVFAFSASFILVVIAYLMLGIPSKTVSDLPLVEGTTVLEMLWIGAHTNSLRNHLKAIDRPTLTKLRSGGMFIVNLTKDQSIQESRDPEVAPLLARGFTTFEFEDSIQGIIPIAR